MRTIDTFKEVAEELVYGVADILIDENKPDLVEKINSELIAAYIKGVSEASTPPDDFGEYATYEIIRDAIEDGNEED